MIDLLTALETIGRIADSGPKTGRLDAYMSEAYFGVPAKDRLAVADAGIKGFAKMGYPDTAVSTIERLFNSSVQDNRYIKDGFNPDEMSKLAQGIHKAFVEAGLPDQALSFERKCMAGIETLVPSTIGGPTHGGMMGQLNQDMVPPTVREATAPQTPDLDH